MKKSDATNLEKW